LMFSLMFSQALFMSSSSRKFSKAANLFVISIQFCCLTSSSFSFLRINLSASNLCAAKQNHHTVSTGHNIDNYKWTVIYSLHPLWVLTKVICIFTMFLRFFIETPEDDQFLIETCSV
jgi:hypothetical protein